MIESAGFILFPCCPPSLLITDYSLIMRLLDTSTLKLCEFYGSEIPYYVILSHTWTKEEVSLQMLEDQESRMLAGYAKINYCCELALAEGWKYAWIDTCCIDKTSSADLSEAINAMYGWYEKAQACYVYLEDVSTSHGDKAFHTSRWFSRGWTLQELLAPKTVVFYNKDWEEIGTKWSLRDEITQATGIMYHQMTDHKTVSVATKMSWAASRKTTRDEDTAYCLLGLFDINMSLLYGEGATKAFMRLQHEILQSYSYDESIFAWKDAGSLHCGLLARSPAVFASSGNIISVKNPNSQLPQPSITKRLLTMDGWDSASEYQHQDPFQYTKEPSPHIVLNCIQEGVESSIVGIELIDRDVDRFEMSASGGLESHSSYLDYFVRSSPGHLLQCKSFRGSMQSNDPKLIHKRMNISLDHLSFSHSDDHQHQFTTILPSLVNAGFSPSEKYPETSAFEELLSSVMPLRPKGWKVRLGPSRLSIAAMMFRNTNGQVFAVILSAIDFGLNVDVVVPQGKERLKDIVHEASDYLQRRTIADQSSGQLQGNTKICATSRKRFMYHATVYFVDIKISATTDLNRCTPKDSTPRHSRL